MSYTNPLVQSRIAELEQELYNIRLEAAQNEIRLRREHSRQITNLQRAQVEVVRQIRATNQALKNQYNLEKMKLTDLMRRIGANRLSYDQALNHANRLLRYWRETKT